MSLKRLGCGFCGLDLLVEAGYRGFRRENMHAASLLRSVSRRYARKTSGLGCSSVRTSIIFVTHHAVLAEIQAVRLLTGLYSMFHCWCSYLGIVRT